MSPTKPLRFFGRLVVVLMGLLAGFMGAFNAVFSDGVASRQGAIDAAVYVFLAYVIAAFPVAAVAPKTPWRWVWMVWIPGMALIGLYAIREPGGVSWYAAVALYAWTGAFVGAFAGVGLRRLLALRSNRGGPPRVPPA